MTHVRATRGRPLLPIAALALGLALLAVACGGGATDSDQTTTAGAATFDISLADPASPATASAEFQPREFILGPGQRVTFNLTNIGQAVHTMRIAGRDNKYETDDDAVVEPYFVKSGETAVLTWTSPKEPGTYNFRCDFHPQSVGVVVVR